MKLSHAFVGVALLAFASVALAQVKTGARPKEATALCKDGSFYSGNDQAAACARNGGLQEWWGKNAAPKGGADTKVSPAKDPRGPFDKAEHPQPVVPPAH